MRNFSKYILGLASLLLLLSSCSSSKGFIFALHTDSFQKKKSDLKKVICINPTYRKFEDTDFDDEDYEFASKFKQLYNEVYSPYSEGEKLTSYYKDLLPLKSAILKSLNVQDNPMNEVESNTYKKEIIQKFVVPTMLPAELAELVGKYDTPYFSLVDIYTSNGKSYLFHVIVDLNLGRIEYQEIKGYSGLVKKSEMKMFVYDSFYLLDKFFKK